MIDKNNMMFVYLKTKGHLGNTIEIAHLVYGPYKKNVILEKTNKPVMYPNIRIVGLAIRYLLANGLQQYPIEIVSAYSSSIRDYNHLNQWAQQGWPMSKYTSSQLYTMRPKGVSRISLTKIPKNYSKVLPIFQWSQKQLKNFNNGIHFMRFGRDSQPYAKLTSYVNSLARGMKPSPIYLEKRQQRKNMKKDAQQLVKKHQSLIKQGKSILSVAVNSNLRKKLDTKLQQSQQSESSFLTKVIQNYVNNN